MIWAQAKPTPVSFLYASHQSGVKEVQYTSTLSVIFHGTLTSLPTVIAKWCVLLVFVFTQQEEWEAEEMKVQLDFSEVHIDPAPFQLVERTAKPEKNTDVY